ncbi:MAG TPA: hypothetical protein PLB21_01760 [Actinomycetota bacterium]|nr:hypothetical protein [Actinomycetota bacterium]
MRTTFAVLLAAGAITATGLAVATPASATPTTPQSASATELNGAVLKDVSLTLHNNTDMAFQYRDGSDLRTLLPGQRIATQGDGTRLMAWLPGPKAGNDVFIQANAFNHGIGTPDVRGMLTVGGETRQRTEHQGEDEYDKLVELHGLSLSGYRHADTATKNFTVTIDKHSAAKATVDNTASARNTYVYIDGKLHPVRKGQTAALPELARGKSAAWTFKTGGHDQTVYVTWVGQTATFTTPGRPAVTLLAGQSAQQGNLTISRADTGHQAVTAYTLKVLN